MFYICKYFYNRCSSSTEVMLGCTPVERKSNALHCTSFFDCRWKRMSGGASFAQVLLHEFWNCSCFRCLFCLLRSLGRTSWLLSRWPARFSSVFQEEIVFGVLTCDLKLRWKMSDGTSHPITHLPRLRWARGEIYAEPFLPEWVRKILVSAKLSIRRRYPRKK